MRGFLCTAVFVIGTLATILGLWWVCQGTGLVPLGFMAHHMQWAYRGAVLAAVGVALVFASRHL